MITILICSLAINLFAVNFIPFVEPANVPLAEMQSVNNASNLFAVNFTPFVEPANVPLAEMQSVNNASFMSSGSTHASTISIYEVESSTPEATGRSIRKAPPGTGGESGYDPNNPQFSPLGDAVLPLLALAILYAAFLFLHFRRRQTCRVTQAE